VTFPESRPFALAATVLAKATSAPQQNPKLQHLLPGSEDQKSGPIDTSPTETYAKALGGVNKVQLQRPKPPHCHLYCVNELR